MWTCATHLWLFSKHFVVFLPTCVTHVKRCHSEHTYLHKTKTIKGNYKQVCEMWTESNEEAATL